MRLNNLLLPMMAVCKPFQNLVFLFVLALPLVISQEGTHPNLEALFLGRCYDFKHTHGDLLPRVNTDCLDLKTKFFQAFVNKSECGTQMKDFHDFIDAARQEVPADKQLFWSGTNYLAHRFSNRGKRYITLEDTLTGYLADGLQFCGQESHPGINYATCPDWYECPTAARDTFWTIASEMFAKEAKGEVRLMLDGSNPKRPAFKKQSFFGTHELQNLNPSKVTKMHVLLSHQLGKTKIETCDSGSLLDLRAAVEAKGLEFLCHDDPLPVMFVLCADDPHHWECNSLYGNSVSRTMFSYSLTVLLPLIAMTWFTGLFQD